MNAGLPAIHRRKEEVGALFHTHFGTPADESSPDALAAAAREHLRDALLHIVSVGIEKIIATLDDLGVLLRVLARSATGQPITAYTTHITAPRPGAMLHVVLVDNGRTARLADPEFRSALHCIRCGACLNTCPVYRRSGGHSYHYTIAGPIGAILAPAVDLGAHRSLPFASVLCGSCKDVCPVRIDIPDQLLAWRARIAVAGALPKGYADIEQALVIGAQGARTLLVVFRD